MGLKSKKQQKNGKKPQDFVDEVSENFKNLGKKLEITNTDFIRTTESRHKISAIHF